jgi:hypothetical protein
MKAGAYQLDNLAGSTDLEAILFLTKQNKLRYEYLDQDAASRHQLGLDDRDNFALVQFKFSRRFPAPSLRMLSWLGPIDMRTVQVRNAQILLSQIG